MVCRIIVWTNDGELTFSAHLADMQEDVKPARPIFICKDGRTEFPFRVSQMCVLGYLSYVVYGAPLLLSQRGPFEGHDQICSLGDHSSYINHYNRVPSCAFPFIVRSTSRSIY